MKRSDALVSLSHDHHAGLAFAAQLRKARASDEAAKNWVDAVDDFWRDDLIPHFTQEEALILPILRRGAPELSEQMLREHADIRALVDRVAMEPPAWDGPLGGFADVLVAHIRFEERDAFPAAERLASEPVLEHVRRSLASNSVKPPPLS